jgi:hypothetical protein
MVEVFLLDNFYRLKITRRGAEILFPNTRGPYAGFFLSFTYERPLLQWQRLCSRARGLYVGSLIFFTYERPRLQWQRHYSRARGLYVGSLIIFTYESPLLQRQRLCS